MAWWLLPLLFVGSVVLQALLTKGPKVKAGDPTYPKADEGEPIPVLWGTVKVAPSCVWVGDVRRKRIKDGDLKRVTVGFQYFCGLQLVIGWGPLDELVEVYVGEKPLSPRGTHREVVGYTGPYNSVPIYSDPIGAVSPALPLAPADVNTPDLLTLKDPELFGAKKREGGIGGNARLHWGSAGQGSNTYLRAHVVDGATAPAFQYPGIAYLVVEGMYLGNSPQLAPIAVAVRRFPKALSTAAGHPEWARVGPTGEDANAAEMIYEVLTSPAFGYAMDPAAEIDAASFTACAATLHAEGLGLSLATTSAASGADTIRTLLRHVDAVLYQHPTTGTLTLALVRADYADALAAGALPVLDDSNAGDVAVERAAWRALPSQVVVRYTDRARNYRTGEATWDNEATWFAGEGEHRAPVVEEYPAAHTAAVAATIAERLGRVSTTDVARLTASVDRRAVALTPGGVAVANFPGKGMVNTVVRISTVDYGDLEDGRVRIQAVEDLFDVTGGTVAPPPDPAGVDAPLAPSDGALDVSVARQEDATTGTVVLTVEDPDAVVTAVEFRTAVGGGTPGAWTAASEPYAWTITRDATRDTRVEWRVVGDVDGETGAVLAEGAEAFAALPVVMTPVIVPAIDASGIVSATVPDAAGYASVYLAAGTVGGTAPDAAAVLAGTPDAASPYSFAALATLTGGEFVYLSSIAVDALGNQSALASVRVARETSAGGIASGTPGDAPHVLHAATHGSGWRITPASGLTAHKWTMWVNFPSVAKVKLQADVRAAGASGTEVVAIYSTDGGATPLETGAELDVATASTGTPRVPRQGAWAPLDAGAQANNILVGIGSKGGDGSTPLEIGDVFLHAVSSASPPPASGGGAPMGGGGGGGSLTPGMTIWYDASQETGYSNGDELTSVVDQTGNGYHGTDIGASHLPLYETNVANGQPGLRCGAAADVGDAVNHLIATPGGAPFASVTAAEMMLVVKRAAAATAGSNAGICTQSLAAFNFDFDLYPYQGDGKLYMGWGSTTRRGPLTVPGGKSLQDAHVLSVATESGRYRVWLDDTLLVDDSSNTVGFLDGNLMLVGASSETLGFFLNGWVLEFVYRKDALLTDAERAADRAVLYSKYGITP